MSNVVDLFKTKLDSDPRLKTFEEEWSRIRDIYGVTDTESDITIEDLLGLVQGDEFELVFQDVNMATAVGGTLIKFEEFNFVSHFEVRPCVSRVGVFYQLVPVPKSDLKYIYPNQGHMKALLDHEYARTKSDLENEITNRKGTTDAKS